MQPLVATMLLLAAGAAAAAPPAASMQLRSCSAQEIVLGALARAEGWARPWGAGVCAAGAAGLARQGFGGERVEGQIGLRLRGGAKSKNHTNHNQNRKAHRNGIKRVRTHRHETTKYMAIKMWRNTKYARKGSMRIHRRNLQIRAEAKKAASSGSSDSGAEHVEATPAMEEA